MLAQEAAREAQQQQLAAKLARDAEAEDVAELLLSSVVDEEAIEECVAVVMSRRDKMLAKEARLALQSQLVVQQQLSKQMAVEAERAQRRKLETRQARDAAMQDLLAQLVDVTVDEEATTIAAHAWAFQEAPAGILEVRLRRRGRFWPFSTTGQFLSARRARAPTPTKGQRYDVQ